MSSATWLVLVLVLVLEGLGPMLYPKAWRKMISAIINLPDNILRRLDGGLTAAGITVYYMLRKTIGRTKNRLIEVTSEHRKCCNSKKMMVGSILKQTMILKNGW